MTTEVDEPVLQETETEESPTVEKTAANVPQHTVRLLAFENGLLIIGEITRTTESSLFMRLPYEVLTEFDQDESEILSYELRPFLRNLTDFEVDNAKEVFFNTFTLMSCVMPTRHLLRNYGLHLKYALEVENDMNGIVEEEIMTLH